MGEITGLLIALGIGLPLLIGAVLLDRRRQRRLEGAARELPDASPAEVSDVVPAYITQSEIDALAQPAGPRSSQDPPSGHQFSFGHAAPEFATAGDVCELSEARVLIIAGDVDTMRELITPLATWSPLVIAAHGFHDDVLKTLRANRKALKLSVAAVIVRRDELDQLAKHTGGILLEPADLHAGYVPEAALGVVGQWWSTSSQTRISDAT